MGGYPENIILADSTVDNACLIYILDNVLIPFDDFGSQILKQLRELQHLKLLCLSGLHVLEAIAQMKRGGLPFPKFLELEEMCELLQHSFDAEGLLELLHAAPCLKSLKLSISIWDQYNYDAAESSVPSCLVSHLERVELVYACGDPNFNLIKFFLRKGLRLKSVLVCGSPNFPTDEIINQLSTFPKVSTCVTIEPL